MGIYVDKFYLLIFTVKVDIFFKCHAIVLYQSVYNNLETMETRNIRSFILSSSS